MDTPFNPDQPMLEFPVDIKEEKCDLYAHITQEHSVIVDGLISPVKTDILLSGPIKDENLDVKPQLVKIINQSKQQSSFSEFEINYNALIATRGAQLVKSEFADCGPNVLYSTEEIHIKEEPEVSNQPLEAIQSNISLLCTICGYQARDVTKLRSHTRTHTGEKPYGCTDCSFRTAWRHALRQHMTAHTGEKPMQCQYCDYRTSTSNRLQTHMLSHSEDKSFKCKVCHYETARKGHLDRHNRTHTGEKPFVCNECNFRTARKSHLQRHIMIHTGEKPFECSQCGLRTSQKDRLKQHMKTHSGSKPFRCNQCKYKTAWKQDLDFHLKIHSGAKPFECHKCGYKTALKATLKLHIAKMHCKSPNISCGKSELTDDC